MDRLPSPLAAQAAQNRIENVPLLIVTLAIGMNFT
jgi:hypothetical protein